MEPVTWIEHVSQEYKTRLLPETNRHITSSPIGMLPPVVFHTKKDAELSEWALLDCVRVELTTYPE